MTAPPIEPGQILLRKYRVERVLGQGAMGLVVAATHLKLDTPVALKVMLTALAPSPDLVARFEREAKIATRLKSHHTGRVSDFGTLDGGVPYFEMELLQGRDLSQVLEDTGPLPVHTAVGYVLQACHAVAEAHALGVVHRDLKPANLFLTKDPSGWPMIKVLDFGVSKLEHEDARLTRTGQGLGSPLYMAPEMMRGAKHIDGRADIWALGVVLYELLSEQMPFTGNTIMDISAKVIHELPVPLSGYRPDLPPGLDAVIMRCFEKDPGRRWPSVPAFAVALAPYAPPSMAHYVGLIAGFQGADGAPPRSAPGQAWPSQPYPSAPMAGTPFSTGAPYATGAPVVPSAPFSTGVPGASHPSVQATGAAIVTGATAPPRSRLPLVMLAGAAVVVPLAAFGAWRGMASRSAGAAPPSAAPVISAAAPAAPASTPAPPEPPAPPPPEVTPGTGTAHPSASAHAPTAPVAHTRAPVSTSKPDLGDLPDSVYAPANNAPTPRAKPTRRDWDGARR